MKYHIDVSSVLRQTVCDLYSNLVTRSTGAAVRKAIEDALATLPEPNVTVIDFSQVTTLDFSCADEVVGKLLVDYQRATGRPRTYFLIRGVHEAHLEAIEAVLERYNLAVIVQNGDGHTQLVGAVRDGARRAWQIVCQHGALIPQQLDEELGESSERLVDELWTRRLLVRRDDGFVALPHAM
jgi:hypothetical protein